MTGRELIIYILENNLEDKPVWENGSFLGFMTENDAATKFGVGIATVRAWIELDMVPGIKIGTTVYIPANTPSPIEEARHA